MSRFAGAVPELSLIPISYSRSSEAAQLKDLGVTVHERVALDSQGNVIERLPYEQVVTSWDRVHQIMRATIPQGTHHLGYSLKAIEQDADSVTAFFENGEQVTGDLLVGADGFRSVVRNMFAPEIQPIYAGYVVWRGLADEDVIPKEAHAAIFDKFAFFLPLYNKNIGYPIAGPDNDCGPVIVAGTGSGIAPSIGPRWTICWSTRTGCATPYRYPRRRSGPTSSNV